MVIIVDAEISILQLMQRLETIGAHVYKDAGSCKICVCVCVCVCVFVHMRTCTHVTTERRAADCGDAS